MRKINGFTLLLVAAYITSASVYAAYLVEFTNTRHNIFGSIELTLTAPMPVSPYTAAITITDNHTGAQAIRYIPVNHSPFVWRWNGKLSPEVPAENSAYTISLCAIPGLAPPNPSDQCFPFESPDHRTTFKVVWLDNNHYTPFPYIDPVIPYESPIFGPGYGPIDGIYGITSPHPKLPIGFLYYQGENIHLKQPNDPPLHLNAMALLQRAINLTLSTMWRLGRIPTDEIPTHLNSRGYRHYTPLPLTGQFDTTTSSYLNIFKRYSDATYSGEETIINTYDNLAAIGELSAIISQETVNALFHFGLTIGEMGKLDIRDFDNLSPFNPAAPSHSLYHQQISLCTSLKENGAFPLLAFINFERAIAYQESLLIHRQPEGHLLRSFSLAGGYQQLTRAALTNEHLPIIRDASDEERVAFRYIATKNLAVGISLLDREIQNSYTVAPDNGKAPDLTPHNRLQLAAAAYNAGITRVGALLYNAMGQDGYMRYRSPNEFNGNLVQYFKTLLDHYADGSYPALPKIISYAKLNEVTTYITRVMAYYDLFTNRHSRRPVSDWYAGGVLTLDALKE